NNHARDFGDDGIGDTIAALRGAGLAFQGATADGSAESAHVVDAHGTRVGLLAWTTVDGSFVNDSYPKDTDPEPPGVDPKDAFQYAARSWSFTGEALDVPLATRRIGSAWDVFKTAESHGLSDADERGGWGSLAGVYPE